MSGPAIEALNRLVADLRRNDDIDPQYAVDARHIRDDLLALFDRAPDTGPAGAADELRGRIEALHRPVRVQVGSKTHGGGPEYGEVCVRDRERWPCQEAAALAAPPAPTTTDAADGDEVRS